MLVEEGAVVPRTPTADELPLVRAALGLAP
jgi:hypothetical protein